MDETVGTLAELGPGLCGPWADHLEGPVWELRLRLRDVAPRVTYWITPTRTVVLLTVFRKTRQHEQGHIERAVRAQKVSESEHHGPVTATYERKAWWSGSTAAGLRRASRRKFRSGSPSVRHWLSARLFTTAVPNSG
ncbi:type II toxin-antitoxin system RelE/ParE family toxin [Streptomyces sp. BA2]|uniref:type II toxin-antitoxin system RelE/ParE family toxin n=1 Tax=Streptomyces sp. BA2 TaxID=436595 RepID=UPI00301561AB